MMEKMENNILLNYPIICLGEKDSMIYLYSNYLDMRKTSEELLGIWNNFKLIDSQGLEYKVLEVKKTGLRGIFGWHPLLKGKSIYVDYVFSEGIKVDFNKLKYELINRVEKSKQFWKEAWSIKELRKAINEAKTFEELIVLFR
jgi:hypothetical protein